MFPEFYFPMADSGHPSDSSEMADSDYDFDDPKVGVQERIPIKKEQEEGKRKKGAVRQKPTQEPQQQTEKASKKATTKEGKADDKTKAEKASKKARTTKGEAEDKPKGKGKRSKTKEGDAATKEGEAKEGDTGKRAKTKEGDAATKEGDAAATKEGEAAATKEGDAATKEGEAAATKEGEANDKRKFDAGIGASTKARTKEGEAEDKGTLDVGSKAAEKAATETSSAPVKTELNLSNDVIAAMIIAGEELSPTMTSKEKDALRTKFKRSMEATTERHGRTNGGKVPQEVALKIKAEGPKTLDHYFKLWMQCNFQWGRVTIVEKLVEIEIHSKESSKLWFTEKELVDKFGEEAAAGIKAEKSKLDDEWRPHPDAPTCKAATQYVVQEYDRQRYLKQQIKQSETELQVDVEQAEAKCFLAERLKNASSSSSVETPPKTAGGLGKSEEDKRKDEQVRLEKERKDSQKIAEREKKKEENKAQKLTPAYKAQKASAQLLKLSGSCREYIACCKAASNIPTAKASMYAKLFQAENAALLQVKKDIDEKLMSSGSTDAKLEPLIKKAEEAECGYRQQVRSFKTLEKLYED